MIVLIFKFVCSIIFRLQKYDEIWIDIQWKSTIDGTDFRHDRKMYVERKISVCFFPYLIYFGIITSQISSTSI